MSVFLTPELQPFLGGAGYQHASHASCLMYQSAVNSVMISERWASDEYVPDMTWELPTQARTSRPLMPMGAQVRLQLSHRACTSILSAQNLTEAVAAVQKVCNVPLSRCQSDALLSTDM